MELEEDKKPNRFWTKYINKPNNQNLPVPISVKIEYAKQRIRERGNKRAERFNLTHKLQWFSFLNHPQCSGSFCPSAQSIQIFCKYFHPSSYKQLCNSIVKTNCFFLNNNKIT